MKRRSGTVLYLQMIFLFFIILMSMFAFNYLVLFLLSKVTALHMMIDSTEAIVFTSLGILFFFTFALVFEIIVAMFVKTIFKKARPWQRYFVSIIEATSFFLFLLLISTVIPGVSLSWLSILVLTILYTLLFKVTEGINFSYILNRITRTA
ncbi:MAG TPA: hypothetical protein VLA13_10535 [Massilibacterium sp.]|mgnify:CR=1 FL=1|nr:hypothetical protein [Massilibacterium sp.]